MHKASKNYVYPGLPAVAGAPSERVRLGVDVLDAVLPRGVYRNSFVVLAGPGGAGKSVIVTLVTSAFMARGEPVVYVALDDDPRTVVQNYASLGIDVGGFIRRELFAIIDGFSHRLGNYRVEYEGVVRVVEPGELEKLPYTLVDVILEKEMSGRGLVVLDSVNELLMTYDRRRAIDVMRRIRAIVSKGNSVLTLAVLHTSTAELAEFLRSIEHLVDGVVEVEVSGEIVSEGGAVRLLRVRKMKGVLHLSNAVKFYIGDRGAVLLE
ncbi:MAG: AAA family ATPase [Thermoprotei archaeon]|nr:MAG: AAA family ATPase [Thermoprotei archaeon]